MDDAFKEIITFLGFTGDKRELIADEASTDFEDFLSITHE